MVSRCTKIETVYMEVSPNKIVYKGYKTIKDY